MLGIEFKDVVKNIRGTVVVKGERTAYSVVICLSADGCYYATVCLGLVVRYTEKFNNIDALKDCCDAGLNLLADMVEGKV